MGGKDRRGRARETLESCDRSDSRRREEENGWQRSKESG